MDNEQLTERVEKIGASIERIVWLGGECGNGPSFGFEELAVLLDEGPDQLVRLFDFTCEVAEHIDQAVDFDEALWEHLGSYMGFLAQVVISRITDGVVDRAQQIGAIIYGEDLEELILNIEAESMAWAEHTKASAA